MTQEDPFALARLLGVSADTEPDRLRAAYEQAMNRATRAGDHSHALALSRAFDALPDRTRTAVYSGGRTYATVLTPEPARRRGPRRRRDGGSSPVRPSRRRRFSPKGALIYGILIPAVVVLVGWAIYRQNNPSYDDTPPPQQSVPSVVGPSVVGPSVVGPSVVGPSVAQAPAGPGLRVPADAPVASNGLASVLCQAAPGSPGVVLAAPPGATVTCPNGAVPRVIAP